MVGHEGGDEERHINIVTVVRIIQKSGVLKYLMYSLVSDMNLNMNSKPPWKQQAISSRTSRRCELW
jgi:hypothetical protein